MTLRKPFLLPRPGLAHWLADRGLMAKDAAEPLGVNKQTVRRFCLPFGNPERRVPDEEMLRKIVVWTDGAVTAESFYPPELTRDAGAEASA